MTTLTNRDYAYEALFARYGHENYRDLELAFYNEFFGKEQPTAQEELDFYSQFTSFGSSLGDRSWDFWRRFSFALDAVAFWTADSYSGSGPLQNSINPGTHDAAFPGGLNDPLFLKPEKGVGGYIYLPGVAGNYLNTPSGGIPTDSTTVDFRARAALDDWTPASQQNIIGANSTHRQLKILANGDLQGSVLMADVSSATGTFAMPALANKETVWLRYTLNLSTGIAEGFYSLDNTNNHTAVKWTSLGTVNTGKTGATHPSTSRYLFGQGNETTADPMKGRLFAAVILHDGSPFLDVAMTVAKQVSWSEKLGKLITVNRAATGRKTVVVDRPLFLFGTDDYLEVPDHNDLDFGATESLTVAIAMRRHSHQLTVVFIGKRGDIAIGGASPGNPGWLLRANGAGNGAPTFVTDEGTPAVVNDPGPDMPTSVVSVAVGRRDRSVGNIEVFTDDMSNGVSSEGAGRNLGNALPVRIGATSSATPANYADMEFMAAAIFRKALTDDEIADLTEKMLEIV